MTAVLLPDWVDWEDSIDDEGHRTYTITFKVETNDPLDGPYTVEHCSGLPAYGSTWHFGNDNDIWAWCKSSGSAKPLVGGQKNNFWTVTRTFSSKPPDPDKSRCGSTPITDPLLEPYKINGGSSHGTEEAVYDRLGNQIVNSAHEQIRGAQVQFDQDKDTVTVEMNVASLDYALCCSMKNTVNTAPLWGFPVRAIKLTNFTWERKFQGNCSIYYTRKFTFEASVKKDDLGNVVSAWDRDLLDEGAKVLNGQWSTTGGWQLKDIDGSPPDRNNPSHFIKAVDRQGNPMRMILNGAGEPANVTVGTGSDSTGDAGNIHVEKYQESNFLLLGVPTSF